MTKNIPNKPPRVFVSDPSLLGGALVLEVPAALVLVWLEATSDEVELAVKEADVTVEFWDAGVLG